MTATTRTPVICLAALALLALGTGAAMANVIVQGAGDDFVAFEAEDPGAIVGGSLRWRVVSTAAPFLSPQGTLVLPPGSNASGGKALLDMFGSGDHTGTAIYRIQFDSPGTYRLYTRQSSFDSSQSPGGYGNEDSFFRPPDFDVDATLAEHAGSSFTEGTFGWRNTGGNYTVTAADVAAPFVQFRIDDRERGYSLDRIAFSKVTGLSGGALDALANSAVVSATAPFLYYSFEPPDGTGDNRAFDYSGNGRDGSLSAIGTGTFSYQANAPAVLLGTHSLLLTEDSTGGAGPPHNAARLQRSISPSDLDFNAGSWSIAGWFQRAADTDEMDMIFHLGSGDGFGGGNELYVYGEGSDALIFHNYFNSARDVDISTTGAGVGEWHYMAVVHDAAAATLSLYLDGALAGSDDNFGLNLSQGSPLVFGGHTSTTFRTERWFDGSLDDLAVWRRALSDGELGALAGGASPLIIPEPATLALVGLGGLGLLIRRRRGD